MQNFVFVLDNQRRLLAPCHPAVARQLQSQGKAKQFRRYPETIILDKDVPGANPQPLTLKIDPGSRVTGFALVNQKGEVIWAMELTHRGLQISASLTRRSQVRRFRRQRKTRYRKARFQFRTKPEGWLAPSLRHRVHTMTTWVNRICRYVNVTQIAMELVRFDTQLIQNPEITGTEYQHGTLAGTEAKEYLLEKFNRTCVYCGARNTPLEVEHLVPRSKGGSNRVSNLALACVACNQAKGNQLIKDYLKGNQPLLEKILSQAKAPLRDVAAVNSTRWSLFQALKETGLPVRTGSGGLTKFNRTRLDLPKTHWIDAACVGVIDGLQILTTQPLLVKATGHGTRQMCRTDKYGFPSRHVPRNKFVKGFQTGDIVKAVVTSGKKVGVYIGRVAVRSTGYFNISTDSGLIQGISAKYCTAIHKKDGYGYTF